MSNVESILKQITVAYEAHDFQAIGEHLAPDFTWMDKDGVAVVSSAAEFLAMLEEYFAANPNATIELSPATVIGNLVTQTEVLAGTADGSVQKFLFVYEFQGDKLSKQWGFTPSE